MNLDIQRGKTISRFVEACRDGNISLVRKVYQSFKGNKITLLVTHCPLTKLSGIHAAAEFNQLQIVQWYVHHARPSPEKVINLKCGHVNVHATPLHYAARAGRHDVIKWLLQNDIKIANKHPLDDQNREPIDWCIERRRDHVEYLFRDLATKPLELAIHYPGKHRQMKDHDFHRDDDDDDDDDDDGNEAKDGNIFQNEWYKRKRGVYVSLYPNEIHPKWKPPKHLGGLPLLGYNVYCRRLRTYIPPIDQTIEGRYKERLKMMNIRKSVDNTDEPSKYEGSLQTKHTVDSSVTTVKIDHLWPACIYLVTVVGYSMLGEGERTLFQEIQTAPCEPTPPTNVTTVRTTCHTITIGWCMPLHQHGSRVTWFTCSYRRAAGGPYKEFAKIACTEETLKEATLKGLDAGEGFRFKVRAKNSVGFSEYSSESRVLRTNDGARLVSRNDREIRLSWMAPFIGRSRYFGNYEIQRKRVCDMLLFIF
jgi:hypothetical protein